ncbi:MAG TPA: hypothetical protein PK443_02710 [bacterium]|nr:hypothetical protein [bacterium]
MTNFYKFIIQTDAYISDGLRQTCETVSDKVKLLYDDETLFWQSQDNYTCKAAYAESSDRFKAYAWDQENNKYAVMYDHKDDDDEALTYGSKATSSFDLTVKLFGKGNGSYRKFTGNATDKTFTMQDLNASGYKLALAGYAQGVGNHFLAKSDNGTEEKYYCFTIDSQEEYTASSGATITVITGLSVGTEGDTTECADLVSEVDSLIDDLDDVTVPAEHFEHEFKAL